MGVVEIIFAIIIILTMGGWMCDWAFSGTVNPIIIDEASNKSKLQKSEEIFLGGDFETAKEEFTEIRCSNCGVENKYSLDVIEAFGKVRCHNCGHLFTE